VAIIFQNIDHTFFINTSFMQFKNFLVERPWHRRAKAFSDFMNMIQNKKAAIMSNTFVIITS